MPGAGRRDVHGGLRVDRRRPARSPGRGRARPARPAGSRRPAARSRTDAGARGRSTGIGQLHVVDAERGVRAAIGQHRAVPVGRDQHHDAAGRQHRVDGEPAVDPGGGQFGCRGRPAGLVGADPGDQRDVDVVPGQPGRGVPAGAAGATVTRARVSWPKTTGPASLPTTSRPTSPTTVTCGRRHACRACQRSMARRGSATATSPARSAFASTRSTFTRRLSPCGRAVEVLQQSRGDVLAGDALRPRASPGPSRQRRVVQRPDRAASSAGNGLASTTPARSVASSRRAQTIAAACAGVSTRQVHRFPESAEVEAGERRRCGSRSPARTASPGTPGWPGTSRIDFTPAHTTSTGVLPARRDRPRRRSSRRRRGARRRARRWRTPRCRPGGPARRSTRPSSHRWRPGPPRRRRRGRTAWRCRRTSHSRSSSAGVQPDPDHAVEHRDGRRDGAGRPHPALDLVGDPPVVAAGQSVRQDRRLQGDDRAAGRQRVGDLGAIATSDGMRAAASVRSAGSLSDRVGPGGGIMTWQIMTARSDPSIVESRAPHRERRRDPNRGGRPDDDLHPDPRQAARRHHHG